MTNELTTESTTDLSTLDPASAEFMTWVQTKCQDDDWFMEFMHQCFQELLTYFRQPNDIIRNDLHAKLYRGSKEHGSPIAKKWDIGAELRAEYLDIIGWSLVGLYLQEHGSVEKDPQPGQR